MHRLRDNTEDPKKFLRHHRSPITNHQSPITTTTIINPQRPTSTTYNLSSTAHISTSLE